MIFTIWHLKKLFSKFNVQTLTVDQSVKNSQFLPDLMSATISTSLLHHLSQDALTGQMMAFTEECLALTLDQQHLEKIFVTLKIVSYT